jgi:hypothetical protein
MECLGLHRGPGAGVHPGHRLTGPGEEEEEDVGKNRHLQAHFGHMIVYTSAQILLFSFESALQTLNLLTLTSKLKISVYSVKKNYTYII